MDSISQLCPKTAYLALHPLSITGVQAPSIAHLDIGRSLLTGLPTSWVGTLAPTLHTVAEGPS